MRSILFKLSAISIAMTCVLPALAEQEKAANDVFSLGTIYVYDSNKTLADRLETTVSKEEMERFEHKNIGTALSRVPGVVYSYAQGNRYESAVTVRGYGMRYVPIYVDGIPVYIPYDGYSDLGRFTTADLSSIQVAKGYSSVMYGHNAMGGVINITTLKPRSELDITGTLGYATGNTRELSANLGSLQNKWYFQAGASELERRFIDLSEEATEDANGNPVHSDKYAYYTKDRRANMKIGYIPNDSDEYVISYSKQTAEKYPRPVKNGFAPTTWEWPAWDRETISFMSNTKFFNEQLYIKPRIYYDKFENTLVGWGGSRNGSHYDDSAFGSSVELGTTAIADHLIKTMVSYKREKHRSFDTDATTGSVLANSDSEATQKFYSVALEDTIKLSDQFEWQIGALYTKRKAQATNLGSGVQSIIQAYPQISAMLAPNIDAWDYQTALFYKPVENHIFHASIAKRTRFPSFKEAYSNYSAGNMTKNPKNGRRVPAVTVQDSGLSPEKAINYEIGYQGKPLEGLNLEAALFLSRSKDAITRSGYDFDSYPGFAVRKNMNIEGVIERKGFELGANYDVSSFFSLGGAYTYLQAKNRDNPNGQLIDIPKHFGNLYATFHPIESISITPSLEARSSSLATNNGSARNPGYTLYHLKLSYSPEAWKYVTFNVGIDNLSNKNYQGYDDYYPSQGRYYYANIRIDFY